MILYELCPWSADLPLVEKDLAERGGLVLFAVAQPEESNRWNILVSAPWLTTDRMNGVGIVAESLLRRLGPKKLVHVGHPVVIDPESPFWRFLDRKLGHEAANVEVLGMLPEPLRHLFVLRWSPSAAAEAARVKTPRKRARAG